MSIASAFLTRNAAAQVRTGSTRRAFSPFFSPPRRRQRALCVPSPSQRSFAALPTADARARLSAIVHFARSASHAVPRTQCLTRSASYTVPRTQCLVHSASHAVRPTQRLVHSASHAAPRTQCVPHSASYTVRPTASLCSRQPTFRCRVVVVNESDSDGVRQNAQRRGHFQ